MIYNQILFNLHVKAIQHKETFQLILELYTIDLNALYKNSTAI